MPPLAAPGAPPSACCCAVSPAGNFEPLQDDAWARFMKEGQLVQVVSWNGQTIGVDMPAAVELKIAATEAGIKGNTAGGGATKPATLETGAVVQVPLFINEGEVIKASQRRPPDPGRRIHAIQHGGYSPRNCRSAPTAATTWAVSTTRLGIRSSRSLSRPQRMHAPLFFQSSCRARLLPKPLAGQRLCTALVSRE